MLTTDFLSKDLTDDKKLEEENDDDLVMEIKKIDIDIGRKFENRMEELRRYAILAENPRDIEDENNRILLFSKLSYGLRRAGEAEAWALLLRNKSKILRKEAEAYAHISSVSDWVDQQKKTDPKFKPDVKMKAHYINTIDSVKIANRTEAVSEAILKNVEIMKTEFIQAISTLRAMCYGHKDSNYLSSAASTEPVSED